MTEPADPEVAETAETAAKPLRTAPRRVRREEVEALQSELESRIAEAEWLKAHYDEQLRSAFAQVASLQARLRDSAAVTPAADAAEIEHLKAEVERLSLAESRYLDRIAELKEGGRRER